MLFDWLLKRKKSAHHTSQWDNCEDASVEFRKISGTGRVAVFAAYFADGRIPERTLFYLRALAEIAEVVFVADNPVLAGELEKLRGLVAFAQCRRHGEYDFGSYKRGVEYLRAQGALESAEELVLCNDSCYGPVRPFRPAFAEIAARGQVDFWGVTSNTAIAEHLQSYFLVFGKAVLRSGAIEEFLSRVRKERGFADVVLKYEIPFTDFLARRGFKWAALSPCGVMNPVAMMEAGVPLVKIKVFKCGLSRDGMMATARTVRKFNATLGDLIAREHAPLLDFLQDDKTGGVSVVMPLAPGVSSERCRATVEDILHQTYRNFELIVLRPPSVPAPELPADDKVKIIEADFKDERAARKIGKEHAANGTVVAVKSGARVYPTALEAIALAQAGMIDGNEAVKPIGPEFFRPEIVA